jgi:hypothetical protein
MSGFQALQFLRIGQDSLSKGHSRTNALLARLKSCNFPETLKEMVLKSDMECLLLL